MNIKRSVIYNYHNIEFDREAGRPRGEIRKESSYRWESTFYEKNRKKHDCLLSPEVTHRRLKCRQISSRVFLRNRSHGRHSHDPCDKKQKSVTFCHENFIRYKVKQHSRSFSYNIWDKRSNNSRLFSGQKMEKKNSAKCPQAAPTIMPRGKGRTCDNMTRSVAHAIPDTPEPRGIAPMLKVICWWNSLMNFKFFMHRSETGHTVLLPGSTMGTVGVRKTMCVREG